VKIWRRSRAADEACARLQQIPGVGPLSGHRRSIGHWKRSCPSQGREFAAWLGPVPGQGSSGVKSKLLGIRKRGNPYLRKMFTQGARAVVLRTKREGSYLGSKHKSNGMPENLRETPVFHDRRDHKDERTIIIAPGDDSPPEAGYIFADCFSSNPILPALGRRTIHFASVTTPHLKMR